LSSPDIFATPEETEEWATTILAKMDATEEILDCPPAEGGPCGDCEREFKVRRHFGRFDLCRHCLLRRLTVAKHLKESAEETSDDIPF
jgi:hypothetical protein